jgi:hypothetical protein
MTKYSLFQIPAVDQFNFAISIYFYDNFQADDTVLLSQYILYFEHNWKDIVR